MVDLPPHQRLELDFAEWLSITHERYINPGNVVACSSGSAALHLACETVKIGHMGRIAIPNLSMIACARAVTLAGGNPIMIDCDERLLMDMSYLGHLEPYKDIRAVMAVHIYGRACHLDLLHNWAKIQKCKVIEDMAECPTQAPHPDSHAACWSFYKNKIIAGEEGGIILFNDPTDARLARSLRSHGFTDSHDFQHHPKGWNYRLADSLALLVLKSLGEVQRNLRARKQQVAICDSLAPREWRMPSRQSPWVYDFRIKGLTRTKQDAIVENLKARGYPVRHCFKPISSQKEYFHHPSYGGDMARKLSQEIMYLPLGGSYSKKEYSDMFNAIKNSI